MDYADFMCMQTMNEMPPPSTDEQKAAMPATTAWYAKVTASKGFQGLQAKNLPMIPQ